MHIHTLLNKIRVSVAINIYSIQIHFQLYQFFLLLILKLQFFLQIKYLIVYLLFLLNHLFLYLIYFNFLFCYYVQNNSSCLYAYYSFVFVSLKLLLMFLLMIQFLQKQQLCISVIVVPYFPLSLLKIISSLAILMEMNVYLSQDNAFLSQMKCYFIK